MTVGVECGGFALVEVARIGIMATAFQITKLKFTQFVFKKQKSKRNILKFAG